MRGLGGETAFFGGDGVRTERARGAKAGRAPGVVGGEGEAGERGHEEAEGLIEAERGRQTGGENGGDGGQRERDGANQGEGGGGCFHEES